MPPRIFTPTVRVQSNASTRPSSRGMVDDGDILNEITFGNLDEIISERLNTLLKLELDDNNDDKSDVKLKLNSIPEVIKALTKPRNEVSSNDRELLLNQLYNLIVKCSDFEDEYDGDYEYDLSILLKIFQSSKSSNELILSTRSLTSFIIANIDNAGLVYSEDKSLNILNILEKMINDSTLSSGIKQYLVYSYSSIALVIYDGTGGFGVDSIVEFLSEVLLGLVTDLEENGPLINSVIYGIGSLFTVLVGNANLNELIETIIDTLVELLTTVDTLDIVKPVAMLIGLSYEIFNYDDNANDSLDDFEEGYDILPYSNTYEIKTRLEELYKNSSKKISKKDKKSGKSLFKDVLTTINFYSDKKSRILKLISKKSDLEENNEEELVLSHIKLSKSRSLAVKSWFSFFRLIQLKWVFSNGIHTQLANNKQISDIVRQKPSNSYASQFDTNEEPEEFWTDEKTKKSNLKKKHKDLENKRINKLNIALDQSGVLNEDNDI